MDQILKKFNLNIFQYSFGDGNLNYTIEINSKTDIKEFLKKNTIVYFYYDKERKIYSYRLVFEDKEKLLEFKNEIIDNSDIISLRADMQS